MEAIGFTSALVQLGSATFHFYQQLRSLQKTIKHSKEDITTASRRLCQHEEFIQELKSNFETIPCDHLAPDLYALFQQCLVDSEREVQQFRSLLENIGKHRFKSRPLQALETGTRLYLNEDSIQKYCRLLDSQMTRFLYFQTSAQNSQMSAAYSDIGERLTQQGDKALTFYATSESLMQSMETTILSELQGIANELKSKKINPPSLEQSDTRSISRPKAYTCRKGKPIRFQWELARRGRYAVLSKNYRIPCCSIAVTVYRNLPHWDNEHEFSYAVRFKPFTWLSNMVVEWRCSLTTTPTIPFLSLSCACGTICEDTEVLDALGFVVGSSTHFNKACYLEWDTKIPDSKRVRRLLDEGRFSRGSMVPRRHAGPSRHSEKDILSAFVNYHQLCKRDMYPDRSSRWVPLYICCESDPVYQARFYTEYYETLKLLLERGFQPNFSSWNLLLEKASRDRCHVTNEHPELRGSIDWSYSVPLLIQNAAGFVAPLGFEVALIDPCKIQLHINELLDEYPSGISSILCPLIHLENCTEIIKRELLDFDPPDLAADEMKLDRWILVLFSAFRPDISALLDSYLETYQTMSLKSLFRLGSVLEEIPLSIYSPPKKRALLQYIGYHGRFDMIASIWPPNAGSYSYLSHCYLDQLYSFAARSHDARKFDQILGLSHCGKYLSGNVLHTRMVQDRLVHDLIFRKSLIDSLMSDRLVQSNPSHHTQNEHTYAYEPIWNVLGSWRMKTLLAHGKAPKLPEYVDILLSEMIQRYETAGLMAENVIAELIGTALIDRFDCYDAEDILQPLHVFQVLEKLIMSASFKKDIDTMRPPIKQLGLYSYSGGTRWSAEPIPETDSALKIALGCGMKPAVKILVDAGASILPCTSMGKSPLQLAYENAQSSHPRQWFTFRYEKDNTISLPSISHSSRDHTKLWVAESTDKEMLEILLKALRDRGEEAGIPTQPSAPSNRSASLKSKAKKALIWLTRSRFSLDDSMAFGWRCMHFFIMGSQIIVASGGLVLSARMDSGSGLSLTESTGVIDTRILT
ncbi:hypothetical protein F4810DRAFT_712917 [Camillea tinctor]|nr:hypothetical protein F4810DRAFT_712917 [Camillea tinctor]